MNFTQMHERLRTELVRRIQRGTLSVSLLARQTGMTQPHLSNFLHSKRQLSHAALDRVLDAQRLSVLDLVPARGRSTAIELIEDDSAVPLVSHAAAMSEPMIRAGAQSATHAPAGLLMSLRPRAAGPRRAWQRFVAVRLNKEECAAMEPLLLRDAVVLIDRHYLSLVPYLPGHPNLYAVRDEAQLKVRYIEFSSGRLILRPHNIGFPVELIEIDEGVLLGDLIAGRVFHIQNEC
jgi:transcriptional regulator with XRE-family HTH domain